MVLQPDSKPTDPDVIDLRINLDDILGFRYGRVIWGGYGLASKCSSVTKADADGCLCFELKPESGDYAPIVNLINWLEIKDGILVCNHPMILGREAFRHWFGELMETADGSTKDTEFEEQLGQRHGEFDLESVEELAFVVQAKLMKILDETEAHEQKTREGSILMEDDNVSSYLAQQRAVHSHLFKFVTDQQHQFWHPGQSEEDTLIARLFASSLWVMLKVFTSPHSTMDKGIAMLSEWISKIYNRNLHQYMKLMFAIINVFEGMKKIRNENKESIDPTVNEMLAWARNDLNEPFLESSDSREPSVEPALQPQSSKHENPNQVFEQKRVPRDLCSYEVARQIRAFLLTSPGYVMSFRNESGEMMLRFCHTGDEKTVSLAAMRDDFIGRNAGRDSKVHALNDSPKRAPQGMEGSDTEDIVLVERPGHSCETML